MSAGTSTQSGGGAEQIPGNLNPVTGVRFRLASEVAAWRAANNGVLLDLDGGYVANGELDAASLQPIRARGVLFNGVHFRGGPLAAQPWKAHPDPRNLVEFVGCEFSSSTFEGVELGSPMFHACTFGHCSFKGSRGVTVQFFGCRLALCDFEGAEFSGTSFIGASLDQCKLKGARLPRLVFGGTHFISTDISVLEGLSDASHVRPSEFSVNTLANLSRDLPEGFARAAGLDPLLLGLFRGPAEQRTDAFYALIDKHCPTRLQSCFISYATPDLAFVARLQKALNAAGVDYWYAPEHGRWGEELQHQVKREIALRDRVIVVCSKSSLDRDWVRFEIEEALDAEKKNPLAPGQRRIFPIMIDDALAEWKDPLKHRLWSILAGDFRGATEPGPAFDAALARLIKGLKTDARPLE